MEIKWSDRLDYLADKMLDECLASTREKQDPFGKICVLVNDKATENWLRSYYLLCRCQKQVLLNLDFVLLTEFVNDWLEAAVQGTRPQERVASKHPYAKNILAWRIYDLLGKHINDADFAELRRYIGNEKQYQEKRRYDLSEKLAQLYDDYLNSRYNMLRNWEKNGEQPTNAPAWQAQLYKLLAKENPNTYASDYEKALAPELDAAIAFSNGFPKYMQVHVFDIPFISQPTLAILDKIATALPMHCWTFNPLGDWLGETQSKKESISQVRRQILGHRKALENGSCPGDLDCFLATNYDSPEERLLGALASGARALIGCQADSNCVSENDVIGKEQSAFDRMLNIPKAIHSCYSPRRELDAIKDGLQYFFKNHPGAKPHDALVLCANWEEYAPIFETTFSTDNKAEGYIPITMAGSISGDSPMTQSFTSLLDFRKNRFQVSAVLELLSIAPIRQKFNLDENGVATIRDMVEKANIHWGYDDEDIAASIGVNNPAEHFSFSWTRGLQRLQADMLIGNFEDKEQKVILPELGRLLPCGSVEKERATTLAILWKFTEELNKLRKALAQGKYATPAKWESTLLDAVNTFYQDDNENVMELRKIRRAICSVKENLDAAGKSEMQLESAVYINAVSSAIQAAVPGERCAADAVLFAPLKTSTATPHKFIWICGLNNGKFPRNEHRCNFDVIGRHPSVFDVTAREKDCYALLKAALSAEEQLSFSFVGRDSHNNDEIPPSVLLSDFEDYFTAMKATVTRYNHPLQSYSKKYFLKGENLPPSYSSANRAIAASLLRQDQAAPPQASIRPFDPGNDCTITISVDDLAAFYAHPNMYILENKFNFKQPYLKQLSDDNATKASLSKKIQERLLLEELNDFQKDNCAFAETETGQACTTEAARDLIDKKLEEYTGLKQYRKLDFTNDNAKYALDIKAVDGYKDFLESENHEYTLELKCENCKVSMPYNVKYISENPEAGTTYYTFYFEKYNEIYASTKISAWIHHLVGNALGIPLFTVMFCEKDEPTKGYKPFNQEEARQMLQELVNDALAPLPVGYLDFDKNTYKTDTQPFNWDKWSNKINSIEC